VEETVPQPPGARLTHRLEREQLVPVSLEEAWSFFSSPQNLARMTPPHMGIVIRASFVDGPLLPGARITYTVRPTLGIPFTWISLIPEVEAPHYFADVQEKGPFRSWRHEHRLYEHPGGTLVHDRLEYALPLGPLGALAHATFVRKQLEGLFAHRRAALERLFPSRA
jgi:ligand-binding SRPBCC domain-containing protein